MIIQSMHAEPGMSKDRKFEPSQTSVPERQTRRRRSFGRMSDQEICAVFEALEPKPSRLGRKWIRAVVAAVIAVCVFVLAASRMAFHSGNYSPRAGEAPDVQAADATPSEEDGLGAWDVNEALAIIDVPKPCMGTEKTKAD